MLSPEEIWRELSQQARIKYVAFKRLMWAFETLLFLAWVIVLVVHPFPPTWLIILTIVAGLRAVTELLNYDFVSRLNNAGDLWRVLYPFI